MPRDTQLQEPTIQVVGIADAYISDSSEVVLVTYSLGSCIGLALHDPVAGIGGLLHFMLPLSRINLEKARHNPYQFGDTGVSALLQELFDRGARRRYLVAKIAGAAEIASSAPRLGIGPRNRTVVRKTLWRNNILIDAEAVGGRRPRTLALDVATGRTTVKTDGVEREL